MSLAYFISEPTANNDVYNQLIASKYILSSFNFSTLGQHPIGIALIAVAIRIIGFDPLIVLYYVQPILVSLGFILIYRLLCSFLPQYTSFFIALNSMSSLILIKSMNQVTAEIISLITLLVYLFYMWKKIIVNKGIKDLDIIFLIFLAWISISMRNAAIFIVLGSLAYIYKGNIFSKLKTIILSFFVILPGIIKSLFFYPQETYPDALFDISAPKLFSIQFLKNLSRLSEIILPYSQHLEGYIIIKIIITFSLLIFFIKIVYSSRISNDEDKMILFSDFLLSVGIFYYLFLSISSIYYNYDWANLYRVSGFGLIFIIIPFWIYTFNYIQNWSNYILGILIFSTLLKIGNGIRYELNNQEYRFLFQDYRQSVDNIITIADDNIDNIYVYANDSWEGTNLYYMLCYASDIGRIPMRIINTDGNNFFGNSMFLCYEKDYKKNNLTMDDIVIINGHKIYYKMI